jgi:hypothetical protein
MKEAFRLIRFGQPDSQGNVFQRGCIKEDVDVPLLRDFDTTKPIGTAHVQKNGMVRVETKEDLRGRVPSFGYTVTASRSNTEKTVRMIDGIQVVTVSMIDPKNEIKT